MNKFLLFLLLTIITTQSVHAVNTSKYFDHGAIYSGSSFPVDAAKNTENDMSMIENLKSAEAATNNILGIIEIGDRSIQTAAKNGGITRIHYVDTKVNKVYIPLGFIPIYVKQTKTIVYGE